MSIHNKKVLRILSTLDEPEWRACYKYLKYCNQKDSKSLQVFEYIYKYRKDLTTQKLAAHHVKTKIFSGLDEKTFLNRLSDLTKDIERFLIHQDMLESGTSYDYKKKISEIYKQRGLYTFFEKSLHEAKKELDKSTSLDLFDHLRWLEVHHALYFSDLYERHSKPLDSLIEVERRRKALSENLQIFYRTEAANMTSLYNFDFNPSQATSKSAIRTLLEQLEALITKKDKGSYDYLQKELYDNYSNLSHELAQTVILWLINHCISALHSGEKDMKENIGQLYLFGMENELLLHHGRISEIRFLNIVDSISNSNKTSIDEKFIIEWTPKVSTNDPESLQNVALAIWSFAREGYGQSLKFISSSEVHLTHSNLSFRARWIQICSLCSLYPNYTEKKELLQAATSFFKRHKTDVSEAILKGSLNLVQIVKLFWFGASREEISSFIKNCDYIIHRAWVNKMMQKKNP